MPIENPAKMAGGEALPASSIATNNKELTMDCPRWPSSVDRLLSSIPKTSRQQWQTERPSATKTAWVGLTEEAFGLPGAEARLRAGVTLDFVPDIVVNYLGGCESGAASGGCKLNAFLYSVADELQVVVWLQDDCTHAHMVFRGDEDLLECVSSQLKHKQALGHCFTEVPNSCGISGAPASRAR